MDKSFWSKILSSLSSVDRIAVRSFDDKYYGIYSLENTNDTYDWFQMNSQKLEAALQVNGFSWCYLIETAPSASPFIYLFTGPNMTKEYIEKEIASLSTDVPEDRNIYFKDCSFSQIDIDRYDNSISALEEELLRKASDVFKVYEV